MSNQNETLFVCRMILIFRRNATLVNIDGRIFITIGIVRFVIVELILILFLASDFVSGVDGAGLVAVAAAAAAGVSAWLPEGNGEQGQGVVAGAASLVTILVVVV